MGLFSKIWLSTFDLQSISNEVQGWVRLNSSELLLP